MKMFFEEIDSTVVRSPKFLTYAAGWLFALISFASMSSQTDGLYGMSDDCGGESVETYDGTNIDMTTNECGYDNYTEFQFLVAIAVIYWVCATTIMIGHLFKKLPTPFQELVSLGVANLMVFCAFCSSASKCDDEYDKTVCKDAHHAQAAVVFMFFLWVACSLSVVFSFREWRDVQYEGVPQQFTDALGMESGSLMVSDQGFSSPPPPPTVSASTQTYGTQTSEA